MCRHVSCTCPPQTCLLSMQALVANANKFSMETLLKSCQHGQGADSKLLFVRAATAAGLMQSQQDLWPKVQAALEGADQG